MPRLPWFKLFKQGQDDQDYDRARRKSSIIKFMRNFFGSPIKKLRTAAEVEDYITEEEGSALAFFERGDTELKAVYSAAAAELRSLSFYCGYVTDPSLREQYAEYDGKIVYIRANILNSAYEDKIAVYDYEERVKLNERKRKTYNV